MSTWLVKCKCRRCGLHFIGCSWEARWRPRHCPECGQTTSFMVWIERSDEHIFQFVPGKGRFAEMMVSEHELETEWV